MHELNDSCDDVREVEAREAGNQYFVSCLARRLQLVDKTAVVKYMAVAMAILVLAAVPPRGILEPLGLPRPVDLFVRC